MWPRLPLAALLAAGIAHTALGAPNLCKNEADFTGHANCASPSSESLASFGYWQNPSPAYQQMTWANVTDAVCDTATDTAASEAARNYVAGAVMKLHLWATTCCGAPDKIRCGLSADDTLCKAAADFRPATTIPELSMTCGSFSDMVQNDVRNPQGKPSASHGAITWSDSAMCSTLSTFNRGTPGEADGFYAAVLSYTGPCCGGLANVRCATNVTAAQASCEDGVARWSAFDRSVSCCDALTEDGSLNLGPGAAVRGRDECRHSRVHSCVAPDAVALALVSTQCLPGPRRGREFHALCSHMRQRCVRGGDQRHRRCCAVPHEDGLRGVAYAFLRLFCASVSARQRSGGSAP